MDLGQQQRSAEMGNPTRGSQTENSFLTGGHLFAVDGRGLTATMDGKTYADWTLEWWLSEDKNYRDHCETCCIVLHDIYHKQKERP